MRERFVVGRLSCRKPFAAWCIGQLIHYVCLLLLSSNFFCLPNGGALSTLHHGALTQRHVKQLLPRYSDGTGARKIRSLTRARIRSYRARPCSAEAPESAPAAWTSDGVRYNRSEA